MSDYDRCLIDYQAAQRAYKAALGRLRETKAAFNAALAAEREANPSDHSRETFAARNARLYRRHIEGVDPTVLAQEFRLQRLYVVKLLRRIDADLRYLRTTDDSDALLNVYTLPDSVYEAALARTPEQMNGAA